MAIGLHWRTDHHTKGQPHYSDARRRSENDLSEMRNLLTSIGLIAMLIGIFLFLSLVMPA
jgi:hypothetical protein